MNILRATGNRELVSSVEDYKDSGVKVKIRHVMPTRTDVDMYRGKFNTKYPIAPCCMATAYVSEDSEELGLKQGATVLLNPYIVSDSLDKKVYGVNTDGFLRDFITVDENNIIQIPEEIDAEDVIFADYVGMAIAAFTKMNITRGDYIAIIGGGVVSLIAAQLAVYYQMVPIFIDSDARSIALAKQCGVFYTINTRDEDPKIRTLEITGGRMAEHTLMEARTSVVPHFAFSLAANEADAVIIAPHGNYVKLETDLFPICQKNLRVFGVSEAEADFNSAVNIMAQGVLNFENYIDKQVPFDEAATLFAELDENPLQYVAPIIVVTK